jgi:hypothetical protein
MSKASATTTWPIDGFDFSPGLATKIGLNEAIVLATIYHQLKKSTKEQAGHYWVFHTLPSWHEHFFPFWSLATVDRAFKSLRESGLLIATSEYNRRKGDRTLWYRIDDNKLGVLTQGITPTRAPIKPSKVRVNQAETGFIVDMSRISAPTAPEAPVVVVKGDTQPAPPTLTTTSSTITPLALEALSGYQGQQWLYLVPGPFEDGWLYWESYGKRVARCTQEQYLLALGPPPKATNRYPLFCKLPDVEARLGEHPVGLRVPRRPRVEASMQQLVADHFGYVDQLGKWKPAPGGLASPRQTTELVSASM